MSTPSNEKSPTPQLPTPRLEPKIDKLGRAYATGKRKESIARVWIKQGNGTITVNGKKSTEYFLRFSSQVCLQHPFEIINPSKPFDVFCTVKGGGLSGQASAIRHGIAKALALYNPDHRAPLKANKLLTRDSRRVERKKYGLRKARRSFQFSKR